jgi:hypothetical protein
VQRAPLGPPSLDPRADAFEIFEGKPTLRALGRAHQVLADRVVDIGGEALFAPTALAKQPLGRTGPAPLEAGPEPVVASPQAVDAAAGERLAITGGGDVLDAEVDAQIVRGLPLGWLAHGDGR